MLFNKLSMSAGAALGLALVPGCASNEQATAEERVEIELVPGKRVLAERWSRFQREHPGEIHGDTVVPLTDGMLAYFANSKAYVFFTFEEWRSHLSSLEQALSGPRHECDGTIPGSCEYNCCDTAFRTW